MRGHRVANIPSWPELPNIPPIESRNCLLLMSLRYFRLTFRERQKVGGGNLGGA